MATISQISKIHTTMFSIKPTHLPEHPPTQNDVKIVACSWNNISHHRNVCPPLFLFLYPPSFPPHDTYRWELQLQFCLSNLLSLRLATMMHLFNNDRLRDLSKSCPTLDATQFLALKHIECASEWIEGIPQFRVTQKGNVVKNNALLGGCDEQGSQRVGFASVITLLGSWIAKDG